MNQKHIRKIILNGLKNTKYIQFDADDKTIALKPKFVDIHLTKSNYKYNFTITQNDEICTTLPTSNKNQFPSYIATIYFIDDNGIQVFGNPTNDEVIDSIKKVIKNIED